MSKLMRLRKRKIQFFLTIMTYENHRFTWSHTVYLNERFSSHALAALEKIICYRDLQKACRLAYIYGQIFAIP